MTATALTPREKMTALADAQSLDTLCASLLMLDAKTKRTQAERQARAAVIDVICRKSPAADAAFNAWALGDTDPRTAVEVIVAAVKGT